MMREHQTTCAMFENMLFAGEWGGFAKQGSKDRTLQIALANYMLQTGITDNFYWCLNPNSGDTGVSCLLLLPPPPPPPPGPVRTRSAKTPLLPPSQVPAADDLTLP